MHVVASGVWYGAKPVHTPGSSLGKAIYSKEVRAVPAKGVFNEMWGNSRRPCITHYFQYCGGCGGEGGTRRGLLTPRVSVWLGLGGGRKKSCLLSG